MRPIDYFDTAAEANGARAAVVDGEVRLSFRDLQVLSADIADACSLASYGHDVGCALLSGNDYRFIAVTLAVMRSGRPLIPLHSQQAASRLEYALQRLRPSHVFFHHNLADRVSALQDRVPPTQWVSLNDLPSARHLRSDLLRGGLGDWGAVREDSTRRVYVRQTSGTTAEPKFVIDDIASFNATYRALHHLLSADGPSPVFLAAAPLSHAAGVFAFVVLSLGGCVVIARTFDVPSIFRLLSAHAVTHLWLPPTGLHLLLDAPEATSTVLPDFRHLIVGAAAVSPVTIRDAVRVFGPRLSVNYSQIECGFLTWLDRDTIAQSLAGDHPERLLSSGRSLCVGRIAVLDEDGTRCPPGVAGEIVVRGASVKDYLDERDTQAARRFGWHHTGDLGYLDRDGYLYVVGRSKDVIAVGGFKVSAAEVERAVLTLDGVAECAALSVPDAVRGEGIGVVATMRQNAAVTKAEVVTACRELLGADKVPCLVEFWRDLPKTAVGKIDKLKIRERYWARSSRSIGVA